MWEVHLFIGQMWSGVENFCKKHRGGKGSVVVRVDILPLAKDASTLDRVVEVVAGVGVCAGEGQRK